MPCPSRFLLPRLASGCLLQGRCFPVRGTPVPSASSNHQLFCCANYSCRRDRGLVLSRVLQILRLHRRLVPAAPSCPHIPRSIGCGLVSRFAALRHLFAPSEQGRAGPSSPPLTSHCQTGLLHASRHGRCPTWLLHASRTIGRPARSFPTGVGLLHLYLLPAASGSVALVFSPLLLSPCSGALVPSASSGVFRLHLRVFGTPP